MAGGGKIQIKGGVASKREAEVIDGALLVTAVGGGVGGAAVIEHEFFAEDASLGVTSLDIMDADPIGPALPILRDCTAEDIGVSFLHDAAPEGGTWTLRLQRRLAGSNVYIEVATFTFSK